MCFVRFPLPLHHNYTEYIMAQQFELIAKTFMGLEPVLAKELTQLGANDVQIGRRMVSFKGDKELMYRAATGVYESYKEWEGKRIAIVDKEREDYTLKYAGVSRYDARNYDFVLNVTNIPGYHVAAFLAQNVRMKFLKNL